MNRRNATFYEFSTLQQFCEAGSTDTSIPANEKQLGNLPKFPKLQLEMELVPQFLQLLGGLALGHTGPAHGPGPL